MPQIRDLTILIVVYLLSGAYTFTVYSWVPWQQPDAEEIAPRVERLGLAIVLGTLLLAIVNNYLTRLIGSKATALVVVLLPIANLAVAAGRSQDRRLMRELRLVLPRAAASAAVCALFILVCLHKLFLWESLAKIGLYPDLPWHVARVAEQAFQSTPGFWPLSPIAFPDALPFQSFVADSLVSATFRYLPVPLHGLTYAQVLFAWAMTLWTAVVLIAGSGLMTSLIVQATVMLWVPSLVWGLGQDGLGYVIYVFFHANPNSLVGSPVGLALVFHLLRSFLREVPPLGLALVLIPPAGLLFKADLAPSFAFLQVVGFVVWSVSKQPRGLVKHALSAATLWGVAIGLARLIGRQPVPITIHPSVKNLWTYIDVAVPALNKVHAVGPLLRQALSYVLLIAGVCTIATLLRARTVGSVRRAMLRDVAVPIGALVTAMAFVVFGWWLIVPSRPAVGAGEPMHVNFELIVWLMSVPIATSLTSLYKEGWWPFRVSLVGAALALTAFMAWTFNTKMPKDGGLAVSPDYDFARVEKVRDILNPQIPGGHCFAYDRRFVIYSDNDGKFPADFVTGATGCPVLNGTRFREYLGNNDPEMLRGLRTIAVGSGPDFRVVDMDPCTGPPSRPGDFAIDLHGHSAKLSWSRSDRAGTYLIEIGSRPGLADVETWMVRHEERQRTVTDARTGMYFVRVRARNLCGVSEASQEIRAVVP